MEQAEQLKLENCTIHHDVIDAIFRQINDKSPVPFKKHTAPGLIYATDYDMGPNGYAYSDTDTADYHTTTNNYTAWNSGYAYRNDGVDIEACTDAAGTNGFNVGWTIKNEWLLYTLEIEKTAAYSIDLRYSASGNIGKVHFELDGVSVTPSVSLAATGGWTTWGTKTIPNVVLKKGKHQLKLFVDNAGFNINFIKIHTPVEVGSVKPEILDIKTNNMGEQIKLTSNLGFDLSSLPTADDFTLKVNNSLQTIKRLYFDETNPEIAVLENSGMIISTDKVLLSYKGNSLKTPDNIAYSPFDDREVVNNAPTYLLLPGRIQAESLNYNHGFQLETCTDTGGGQNLSYAASGDYADYNVYVSFNGLFSIDYRVASNVTGKFELRLVEGDKVTTLNTITVTSTGGWQNWKTITMEANLKQGRQTLRIYAVSGEYNLNWFNVTTITGVDNILTENEIHAVYNKNSNSINLFNNVTSDDEYRVICYDTNGRTVFNRQIEMAGSISTISGISLPKGLYLLHFETKGKRQVQKLIVNE